MFSKSLFLRLIPRVFLQIPLSICLLGLINSTYVYAANHDEQINYYQKWLLEDVPYIITPEEADLFVSLATDQERELFIEQFWRRRDTNIQTSVNEYKEEHFDGKESFGWVVFARKQPQPWVKALFQMPN